MVRSSSRIQWDTQPNALSQALARKKESGASILDLTGSNPTAAGFEYPEDAIANALADKRSLVYEPAAAGILEARLAVSEYYHREVPASRILLTASTSEGYAYLFKLLCDAGDEVLIAQPSYPLFEYLAALENVRTVPYVLDYHHGWTLDSEALRLAITPRTRAIIFVHPNNPTGSFLKRSEHERVVSICREHRLSIISDEVFADYAFQPDPGRIRTLSETSGALTFTLSGLSKVAALPQMKLGWIAVSGPPHEADEAMHRLELISDTYLSVGTPVQYAASKLLSSRGALQEQILRRTKENLLFLQGQSAGTAFEVLQVEAGWYATLQAPRIRSEEEWVLELLEERNVLVQPGFFFDFAREAFLILSLLTAPEDFREGVKRICSL